MDGRRWAVERVLQTLSGQNLAVSIGPEWSWGKRRSYQEDAVSQRRIVTPLEHALFRKHQKRNTMLMVTAAMKLKDAYFSEGKL